MTIALAVFAGALAVAINEAWTRRRGALGWIVNVVVSFAGVPPPSRRHGYGDASRAVHERGLVVCLWPAGPFLRRARRDDGRRASGIMGRALWCVNRWRDA